MTRPEQRRRAGFAPVRRQVSPGGEPGGGPGAERECPSGRDQVPHPVERAQLFGSDRGRQRTFPESNKSRVLLLEAEASSAPNGGSARDNLTADESI